LGDSHRFWTLQYGETIPPISIGYVQEIIFIVNFFNVKDCVKLSRRKQKIDAEGYKNPVFQGVA
jgi:hypothetical protein